MIVVLTSADGRRIGWSDSRMVHRTVKNLENFVAPNLKILKSLSSWQLGRMAYFDTYGVIRLQWLLEKECACSRYENSAAFLVLVGPFFSF